MSSVEWMPMTPEQATAHARGFAVCYYTGTDATIEETLRVMSEIPAYDSVDVEFVRRCLESV